MSEEEWGIVTPKGVWGVDGQGFLFRPLEFYHSNDANGSVILVQVKNNCNAASSKDNTQYTIVSFQLSGNTLAEASYMDVMVRGPHNVCHIVY